MPAVDGGGVECQRDQRWHWGLQAEGVGSPGWIHGQLTLQMSSPPPSLLQDKVMCLSSSISISPPRSLSVSEADCNHMGCEDGVLSWGVWHNPFRWFSFQWRSVFYFLQITELAYPQHLYKDTDDLCCGESSQAKLRPSLVSRFLPLRTELGLCSWRGADLLTQTAGTPGLEKSFCDLYYHQDKIWYLWSLLRLRTWGQRREAIWTWISIYNERK